MVSGALRAWMPALYRRAFSPGERLQLLTVMLPSRRDAVAAATTVARVALDHVLEEREAMEHALDVTVWWASGKADAEGLRAAHRRLAALATEASTRDDRGAWLAAQAALCLVDVAFETVSDVAAKRARDLCNAVVEVLTWPDTDDAVLREEASATLHGTLDAAMDAVTLSIPSRLPRR